MYKVGLYTYKDKANKFRSLPERLKGDNMTPCCAIVQLLMGSITVLNENNKALYTPRCNFIEIPFNKDKLKEIKLEDYKIAFGVENFSQKRKLDSYLTKDQKNNYLYTNVLRELTLALIYLEKQPSESFVHIYRLLEFISYTFPLIYVSRSNNYKGTYDSLKKFFGDNGEAGELKFFSLFLNELFVDEDEDIKKINFEISLSSDQQDKLIADFQKSIRPELVSYQIEEGVLKINYQNIRSLIITIRNKYFHMLAGRDDYCFQGTGYDINDLFRSINPYLINWFASIFIRIFQYGISTIE